MDEIPINDLNRHVVPLAEKIQRAASGVLLGGSYVLGPNVRSFEREFAEYCGVSHCVGVANGTDALELGLRSMGVHSDSRVAVVANAAMYSTIAVLACGAEPVFVDVDPVTCTLSSVALEAVLQRDRIDVVIVTHLYGRLADVEGILALAAKYGFAVFEDCAQAHGARDAAGHRAGSFGVGASFSFYPTKNLGALGDGGAVITNDAKIANTVIKLRQYGWTAKYRNELIGGRNSRLDEFQAAFLRIMLPCLDDWNTRRREIANRYSREICNNHIQVPPEAGDDYVAHLYVVRTPDRLALQHHLRAAGVGSDVHYPVGDHHQPMFGNRFVSTALPGTEAACQTVLTLPCFPELSYDEATQVIRACNSF